MALTGKYKIVQLTIENVKKVKCFHLDVKDNVVIVGGNNAQGKTSVLDSIVMAMAGGRAMPEKPLRDGAEKGYIRLDLDDIIVERKILKSGSTTVTIKTKDGAKYGSPQETLDALYRKISFNPFGFVQMKPDDQIEMLKSLIDFDFAGYNKSRSELYENRKLNNRDVKSLTAQLEGLTYDESVGSAVSATELIDMLQAAKDINRSNADKRQKLDNLKLKAASLKQELNNTNALIKSEEEIVSALKDEDTTELESKIANAEKIGDQIQMNKRYLEIKEALDKKQKDLEVDKLAIDNLDEEKRVATQESKLPIKGLDFTEDGIYLNGVPFTQASSAEQLRTSVALGMALNPQFKVLLIKDGSLLDSTNLALIKEMADEKDYQVFIEKVGEGDEMTVVMEDGMQKGEVFEEEDEED